MTNEEIYKYANKKLKNAENRYNKLIISISGLMCFGLICFMLPTIVDYLWLDAVAFVMLAIYGIVLNKVVNEHVVKKRNYIYNLVRADERNKCMTKMERYEHEGSK